MAGKYADELLMAWLEMAMGLRASRMVNHFSFNEIVICGLLMKEYEQKESQEEKLTATDICEYTHLLKSQINRILTSLEKRGYIERQRSEIDKRKIYISLSEKGYQNYKKSHEEVMDFVDHVHHQLGDEKSSQLIALFHDAMEAAGTYEKE